MGTRKIILYSGGLDSYIGLWLLRRQSPDWTPVYFDLNIRYSNKELDHIAQPEALHAGLYIIRNMLRLDRIEHDDAYIPQRNVLLCAAAQALYGASEIALCSVADDMYADNDADFHTGISALLSHTAGYQVRVSSPLLGPSLRALSKAGAVHEYLELGGDPEMLQKTVSCYDPDELSCGKCKACIRRREALEANGITP
jgi:7-cyano-7-deazaguanine synthase in queuosine biosynthesis